MTEALRSIDPRTGEPFGEPFAEATPDDVRAACAAAARAFVELRTWGLDRRGGLVDAVAAALDERRDALVEIADRETALGRPRLEGEHERTTVQLRAFADLVRSGEHLQPVVDHADPDARPAPRPDLRRLRLPIGPVAVFEASNFPFAFGVPGGDTASALAAGCPVVVKAHPSHPATAALAGEAVAAGVAAAGAPEGTFAVLQAASTDVARLLVEDDAVEAVGFTGSLRGGRALFDAAAARPRPIPVYAEMGSLNPVFVTARAAAARRDEIATGLAASFTLGAGQFCTKPGLVFVEGEDAGRRLAADVAAAVADAAPGVLLGPRFADDLAARLAATVGRRGVEVLAGGERSATAAGACGFPATVLSVPSAVWLSTPELSEEHFGPVTVVVRCEDGDELVAVARSLGGHLTASLHADADDAADRELAGRVGTELVFRAGRVVWGGWPTGVAVTAAMQHGGPYPATTSASTTSVGLSAIDRWLRPVAFQSWPDELLPPPLREGNPLGLRRRVDGRWEG